MFEHLSIHTRIITAPRLADANTIVIYRNSGEEIMVSISQEKKTISSEKKLNPDEIYFIKENYL